jgi:hypothetical protein
MCGGSKKSAPAPVAPTYQYYPEASRTPQQQAAAIEAGNNSQGSFGSELTAGSQPAPTNGGM